MIRFDSADQRDLWPHLAMLGATHLVVDANLRDVRAGHNDQLVPEVEADPHQIAALLHARAKSISGSAVWRAKAPGSRRALLSADWSASADREGFVAAYVARQDGIAALPRGEQDLVLALGHPTHPDAGKPRWACTPWDMTTLTTGGEIVTRRILPAADHTAARSVEDIADALDGSAVADWSGPDLLAGWNPTAHHVDPAVALLALCGIAVMRGSWVDTVTLGGGVWPTVRQGDDGMLGLSTQRKAVTGWWPHNGGQTTSRKHCDGIADTAAESGYLTIPMSSRRLSCAWWWRRMPTAQMQELGRRAVPGVPIPIWRSAEYSAAVSMLSHQVGGIGVWNRAVTVKGPSIDRHAEWVGLKVIDSPVPYPLSQV